MKRGGSGNWRDIAASLMRIQDDYLFDLMERNQELWKKSIAKVRIIVSTPAGPDSALHKLYKRSIADDWSRPKWFK